MTNFINRAIAIATKPKAEWAVVEAEASTTQGLITSYVVPWAVISAVAGVIAAVIATAMVGSVMGAMGGLGSMGMFGASAGIGLVGAVVKGVIGIAVSVGMVILMGIIINALAPSFDAQKDSAQAMKVSAYCGSAVWLASIAAIVPVLGGLVVLAALVWSIFITHWGLVALMKPPADKAVGFSAVVIIIYCLIAIVLAVVVSMIVGMFAIAGAVAGGGLL